MRHGGDDFPWTLNTDSRDGKVSRVYNELLRKEEEDVTPARQRQSSSDAWINPTLASARPLQMAASATVWERYEQYPSDCPQKSSTSG
ncbi:hypothetical protein IV203_014074 [Nitzschia inconspicua]|uniref:Uncharacterized protein n=1 Tax=Nitzschia inconspicua TaxID=303405 RepID=A0A9K3M6R4_9STRA|nr:hypothetical protein IV203_014074 [Nitzschia inconspicua]